MKSIVAVIRRFVKDDLAARLWFSLNIFSVTLFSLTQEGAADSMNSNESFLTDRAVGAEIKVYYDLHTPEETPAPLLIALHGYGANKKQMMREARQMAPPNFAIAALQGFHQHMKEPKEPGGPLRFGFGWLTNFHPEESVAIHHQVVLDVIKTLVADKVVDASNIFLLGFSQSCALNYRFAFTHAGVLRGVIGICGGLPGDWTTSESYRRTEAAVLHLAGNQDEFYTPARVKEYAEQLRRRASDVTFRSYEGGHDFVPEMRGDISAWLLSKASTNK